MATSQTEDRSRLDPTARRIGLLLALGGLVVIVDGTSTIVALPSIVADLDTTLPFGAWVTTGYLLGVIASIPIAGWLAGRLGDRNVYVAGLLLFMSAGVAAGAAPGIEALIFLRILQGLGGGVVNPIGMAIAMRSVPKQRRGAMMSLVGLPILIGPAIAPPLAGLLVDAASWRWLFWINPPLALLVVTLGLRYLPKPLRNEDPGGADWIGLVQVIAGCVALVVASTSIGETGSITRTTAIALVVGLALLVIFVRRCLGSSHPLVRIRLLARRNVAAGVIILACFSGGYFGSMTILPLFVQGVRGDPVSLAGTLSIPAGLAVGVTVQIATRLVDRIAASRVIAVGTGTALVGAALLGLTYGLNSPYILIVLASTLVGIGSGATLMPTMVASSRDIQDADLPFVSSLLTLCSQLGSALGTALVASTITILMRNRVEGFGAEGGLAAMIALDADKRVELSDQLASSVGFSVILPATLIFIAFITCVVTHRRPGRESSVP